MCNALRTETGGYFRYALYWLTVISEIPLPEVAPLGDWDAGPVVHVRRGKVPDSLPEGRRVSQWVTIEGQRCLHRYPGIAAFMVEGGEAITAETDAGGSEDDTRALLLGLVFSTLLYQRGQLPLHVSAVETPEGAVAFAGPAGAGKSTRAAMLHIHRGWRIVSDDVAVVRIVDGKPLIYSGVCRVKMWSENEAYTEVESISEQVSTNLAGKQVMVLKNGFAPEPVPLRAIGTINRNLCPATTFPTSGLRYFETILNALYGAEAAQCLTPVNINERVAALASILNAQPPTLD